MVKVRNIAFVAAPLLLGGYGAARLLGGLPGPSVGWTVGHLLFLAGLVLFMPVLLTLGDRPGAAPVIAAVGLLGVVASVAQVVIDIVAGLVASDRAGMNAVYHELQSVPGHRRVHRGDPASAGRSRPAPRRRAEPTTGRRAGQALSRRGSHRRRRRATAGTAVGPRGPRRRGDQRTALGRLPRKAHRGGRR